MESHFSISVILAVTFFILPIAYKLWKKQKVELSDLAKCAFAAMGLPNLAICLFYLITNPSKAIEMAEVPQYLTIAILMFTYLAFEEIKKTFQKEKKSASDA